MLRLLAVLAALAILALGPAAAVAADELPSDVQSVVDDFRADGEITPCKHTVQALEHTSQLAPGDIAQYSPDFPAAVEAALEARKRDDCGTTDASGASAGAAPAVTATPSPGAGAAAPAPTGSATPQVTASPTPQPTAAATPAPTAAPAVTATATEPTYTTVAHHDPFPAGLWILVGLLALSLLTWMVLALLGRTGWGEERLAGPRHAWGEARYRAGGVWSDFTDWLRLGR